MKPRSLISLLLSLLLALGLTACGGEEPQPSAEPQPDPAPVSEPVQEAPSLSQLREEAQNAGADAAIVFCHWGCKQTMGAAQLMREALEADGLPVLVIDGDGCMRSGCSAGQMSTRLTAFLEMVRTRSGREMGGIG